MDLQKRIERFNDRAMSAFTSGDNTEAIRLWKEGLKLDPANHILRRNLAMPMKRVRRDMLKEGLHEDAEHLREHLVDLRKERDAEKLATAINSQDLHFIHIPKTGGRSVIETFKNLGSLDHRMVIDGDFPKTYYQEHPQWFVHRNALAKHVITTVRNIYSWLVSYYHYAPLQLSPVNIKCAQIAATKDFHYFVHYLANREDTWPCRKLIFFHPFAQPSGEICVDWINRLETIQQDLGMDVPTKNETPESEDYRTYYSDALIEFVQQTWQLDHLLYGFRWEGYQAGLLHKKVGNLAINYKVSTDKVTYEK